MPDTVLVLGGGLAGTACALTLAQGGWAVTLIERSKGPHDKVCGEFLSGEALGDLEALGVQPMTLGAVPLTRARVAARGRAHDSALPFRAASLTRRALDEAMLSACAAAGVEVRRGVTARGVERDGAGWRVRLSDGDLRAGTLVAATGKHDLRGGRRPDGLHGDLVGLKRYVAAPNGSTTSVDLAFFPGGYAGLQPVEDGRTNVCLVVSRSKLQDLGGPDAVFDHLCAACPHADGLLHGSTPADGPPLAIGRVPYGYVRARSDGAYHVGDQAAVIPSFCGEGMGLALRSGRMAGAAILTGEAPDAYQRRFARLAAPRVRGAALLSRVLCQGAVQPAAAALARTPGLVATLAALTRTPNGVEDGRAPDGGPS